RTNREINDLQTAISRLGINYTCNLATGLAMEQMFQATTDVIDRKMREVWNKSTEIAAISHVLCRNFTRLPPDQATLAGLVHQIGVLPILTYAEEHGALLSDSISLNHVIDRIHPIVGERILRTWDFPEPIAAVPGHYSDFERDSARVDYVDIVQVATLQSYLGTTHPHTQMDWSHVRAFDKLGLNPRTLPDDVGDRAAARDAAVPLLQQPLGETNPAGVGVGAVHLVARPESRDGPVPAPPCPHRGRLSRRIPLGAALAPSDSAGG